jgi:NAD-dependent deacetylase
MRVERARKILSDSRKIAVLSGAGVSAESGIPTFRDAAGMWKNYRAEDLASPEGFARDPRTVWAWYDWRRGLIGQAPPNASHHAMVALEQLRPDAFTLITQNVDGLHERAGSRNVLRLHGSIWIVRCVTCGREAENRTTPLPDIPPKCECGGLLRPGVVWFGEALPRDVWAGAERATMTADVLLVIGTSAVVYPAASLVRLARARGTAIIEVNREETAASALADVHLRGAAGDIVPALLP